MALLLMTCARDVVLRDAHWRIPTQRLLDGLPGTNEMHQALPVHVPPRSRDSGVDAATMSAAEVNDRIGVFLRRCLIAYDGSFDPSSISRKTLRQELDEEPVYA